MVLISKWAVTTLFWALADDLLTHWNTIPRNSYLLLYRTVPNTLLLFRFATISRDNDQYLFQFRHVILFICPRILYNYPAIWILRNQWAEKTYTFSGKRLSSHTSTSKKELFSGKPNTTECCYEMICLSYPKFYCCNLKMSPLTECLLFIVCW